MIRAPIRSGKVRIRDHEGMVAAGGKGLRHAAKDTLAVVLHRRELAVHQLRRPHDLAAERDADALMAQADAKQRHRRTEPLNQRHRNACILRTSGPWRDDDPIRLQFGNLVERDLVVAFDERRRAQFAEVLGQVERERIVVVDQQNHYNPASAIASAVSSARALSRVSSYSAAGLESATMPAPAWTRARPSRMVIVRIAMQKSRLPAKSM